MDLVANTTEVHQHMLEAINTTTAGSDWSMSKNEAKSLAILALGVGSFVSGILPLFCAQRNRERFPVLISFLLCFGAGVLLATALVHMLPEVRDALHQYAEIIFCVGFFLIYTVDEMSNLCGAGHGHSHGELGDQVMAAGRRLSRDSINGEDGARCYGTSEETKLLSKGESSAHMQQRPSDSDVPEIKPARSNDNIPRVMMVASGDGSQQVTGVFSLLLALVVHSLLEGLAIGVQDTASKVMLLLGAVSAHKYVVGFCLGVEICSNGNRQRWSHVLQILTFAVGSVAGIAVGMVLDDIGQTFNVLVIPVLQGVAGGTLLYVTVSEVLPRERGKRSIMRSRQVGLLQLFAVILGFTVMSFLSLLISEK